MQIIRHPKLADDIRDRAMHYAEISERVVSAFWANIHSMDNGDTSTKATAATFEQLVEMYKDPRVRKLYASHDSDPCARPADSGRPCGVGFSAAFVRCTGELQPCGTWPKTAGSLLEDSFAHLWHDSPVFVEARAVNNVSLSTCHDCGDRGVCGPCAAMNLQDNGDVRQPSSTVCTSAAARATAFFGESRQRHGERGRLLRILA